MTAPQTTATSDPQSTIAALQQRLDAGLAREAALAEELTARTAELAERNSEFGERIDHQAATIDVLKAMSASPGDAQPVFDLIVRRATELCDVPSATLFEYDGELVHIRSDYRSETILAPSALAAYVQLFPMRPTRGSISCRAILDRQIIHIRDLRLDRELAGFARELGHRSQVSVPLIRNDLAIGVITIGAQAPGGFSDSQIELLKTFAEQAVIAIASAETYRQLEERTAALATRNSEYSEQIEQQLATIDVLKAMSAALSDTQPVFDLITARARELCGSLASMLYEFDGERLHLRSWGGWDPAAAQDYLRQFPMRPDRRTAVGRTTLERRAVHIRDIDQDPEIAQTVRTMGVRSTLVVPLLRDGQMLGAIAIGSATTGGFSDSQVALLQTFAEQAVIAITSAETYRALQTRTSDLQETLEYQTATSDVLKVISRSTFDLQPVLDTLVETAARLCDADQALISRREGEVMHFAANYGFPPEYETYLKARGPVKLDPGSPTVAHRTLIEGRPVHIDDVTAVPGYPEVFIRLGKHRTSLGVPLLRGGDTIGFIQLSRQQVEPFTDRQIALVSTFADQAVIAIENTRLITEQREALEQQTATAEVLQVINASPGNLTPVFEAMLEKAIRLCGGDRGVLWTIEGGRGRLAAARGLPAEFVALLRERGESGTNSPLQRVVQGEWLIEFPDTVEEFSRSGDPHAKGAVEAGVRSAIWVAIVKEGVTVGAFAIGRSVIGTFSDKQIALLQNFAAQAVIAMENARLLTETREALEQQTATAEVLQVINASPGNLTPVFDAMLEKAHSLCGATVGNLAIYKDGAFHAMATHGFPEQVASLMLHPSLPNAYTLELIRGERFCQIEDIRAIEISPHYLILRALVEHTDVRTVLFVPLRKDGALLGFISVNRPEVRPFSDKEIALLENFAAQAVIAMENARLITEQREALEQQTATTEVLQVINASPGDLTPVFDTILEKAHNLCDVAVGSLSIYLNGVVHTAATRGFSEEYQALLRRPYPAIGSHQALIRGGPSIQTPDFRTVPVSPEMASSLDHLERMNLRTGLWVPLRKDGTALGCISSYRDKVQPFSEKEIALLKNFAAQAVIAMENARLINEQREALEQQTATAKVLQVINRSRGDLVPVFDAILESAHSLCDIARGSLEFYDGVRFHAVAVRGLSPALADTLRQGYPASDNPATRPLIEGGRLSHIRDLAETDYSITRSSVETDAARTLLCVPLRRDETLLGMIASARGEVRPFSEKDIALLENFAAQAVIAMENARLINEQREALEQQTATAEVLQVINSSPGDLAPVFDAMLDKAIRLCEAAFGVLWTYDGARINAVALRGVRPEFAEFLTRTPHSVGPDNAHGRLLLGEPVVHIADVMDEEAYRSGDPIRRSLVELGGGRTLLAVPLLKDETFLGDFVIYRQEVRPFTGKQIALLQNFAAQAVIAMENARLLDEIRQRQEELRVTFENMGDGVAMFDETQHLVAWNGKFQEIFDLPDTLLGQHRTYEEHLRFLAARGDFGPGVDTVEQINELVASTGQSFGYERTRPDGRVIEIRRNPVPDGGFVLIFSDITERKRSEVEIRAARDAAEEASRTIEAAYRELKAAQASLIQAEKMASLGQLTAGIAHEIKNPLNFVNNFSDLSVDLLKELQEAVAPEKLTVADSLRTEIDDITATLKGNLEKIAEHGRRADSIVKNMLLHSRTGPSEHRAIDVNTTVEEALNLAYHGARAETLGFNITMEKDLDPKAGSIDAFPQEFLRVMLNLISNGFYAARKRANAIEDRSFEPTLHVTTRNLGSQVEIRVRDNGTGIGDEARDKIFEPFFTTKPAGEGTGLGLSLSYDIIVKQHGGQLTVDSRPNEFTEFQIILPRRMAANEGGRA